MIRVHTRVSLSVCQILGIIMLSVALAGYNKGQTMKRNTDILDQLNLSVLTVIIIAAAAMTVATSMLGLAGAYFRSMIVLKLVSREYRHAAERMKILA